MVGQRASHMFQSALHMGLVISSQIPGCILQHMANGACACRQHSMVQYKQPCNTSSQIRFCKATAQPTLLAHDTSPHATALICSFSLQVITSIICDHIKQTCSACHWAGILWFLQVNFMFLQVVSPPSTTSHDCNSGVFETIAENICTMNNACKLTMLLPNTIGMLLSQLCNKKHTCAHC